MINFYDDLGLNKNQITQVSLEVLNTNPAASIDKYQGRIIFTQGAGSSATSGTLSFYDGTDWIAIGGSGAVTSVLTTAVGTSTGLPLVITPVGGTGAVLLRPMAYDGDTNVGFVPVGSGGTNTLYLDGSGNWTTPTGSGGGTMDNWKITGDTGSPVTVDNTYTVDVAGGLVIDTAVSGSNPAVLTVTHANVTTTPSSTTASLAFGATFPATTTVAVDAQGHTASVVTTTYTMPAAPTVAAYTLVTNPTTPTLGFTTLFSDATNSGQIMFTGTTNQVTVTSAGTTSGVYTSSLPTTLIAPGSVQVTSTLQVDTTSNFTGVATFIALPTIPEVPSASTDAASKGYVDSVLVGALVFQGGYNATTAAPSAGVLKGWTYAVTVAGDASGFWTTPLEIGDVIIAEIDTPTTVGNWTDVQNNIDIATAAATSATAVRGIASFDSANFSVGSGASAGYTGLIDNSVATTLVGDATHTANVQFDTYGVAQSATETLIDIPSSQINNFDSSVTTIISANNVTQLIGNNSNTTFTIPHTLDTRDVIVQVYENGSPYATIFANVTRATTTSVVVTFNSAPTSNQFKVLITKIA